ncbi:ATP synthase subunit delta [Gammaproteobacteria bacterium]
MTDKIAIARPYAHAVFDQANQENAVSDWSEMLTLAAHVVQDPVMEDLLSNPLTGRDRLAQIVLGVAEERFSESVRNFIRLLAANSRLSVLPEILELFNERKSRLGNSMEAEVVSAFPIEPEQEQMLAQALERHFARSVTLKVRLDQELIGGAIIHVGDVVIDGSLRAGLTQMATELRH